MIQRDYNFFFFLMIQLMDHYISIELTRGKVILIPVKQFLWTWFKFDFSLTGS